MNTKRALAIGAAMAGGWSASFGLRRKWQWINYLLVAAAVLAIWRWHTLGWHARGIVLALLGAAFLSTYVIQALWARALLHSGTRAQGTVVKLEEDIGSSDAEGRSGPPAYSPVVEFTTADGRKVVFTGSIGSSLPPEVGSALPVRYRPDDPDQAEIDRPVTWLGPAIFGGALGVGLFVAAVIVYRHQ